MVNETQNNNRYVVVTGASKGIGRATALYLDRLGWHVLAGVRQPADGTSLAAEASSRLIPLPIDVTDTAQIARAAEQVGQVVGTHGLAGLVNNAGVAVAAPLEFIPLADLRHQLEVNLIGQVAVTQSLLPFIRQAHGRIVNISSIGGRVAGPMIGSYHASKYALEAITDSLRVELKPWGIEVIAIEPGAVATPIWETSVAAADEILQRMPVKASQYYEKPMAQTRSNAARSAKQGVSPDVVAQTIAQALTAHRPRTRYLVGMDAKIVGHVITNLPARWRDRLLGR